MTDGLLDTRDLDARSDELREKDKAVSAENHSSSGAPLAENPKAADRTDDHPLDHRRAHTVVGNSSLFQFQRTLKNAIHCSGVGVHSGEKVTMTLRPAEADSGIVFRRTDLDGQPEIKASWETAVEAPLCTLLVDGTTKISTIEHLMSALVGCGIDNAVVELDAEEVPIMDGSAAPFVFLIECAGSRELSTPRKALRILKEVSVSEPSRSASLSPADDYELRFEIEFDNPVVGQQVIETQVDPVSYKRDISRARTFGFRHEVEQMRAAGLGRGGSLDNAIVIDGDDIMNEGGLRYDDEFVRHKALDAIGDLYMAGGSLLGRFEGYKAGHALTLRLLKALFAQEDAYEWVPVTSQMQGGVSLTSERAVAQRA
ncbi:UDP-3-O-acyl-N-acetylglucosamine deacetylase [Rhodovibrionaceae bacterium A322]